MSPLNRWYKQYHNWWIDLLSCYIHVWAPSSQEQGHYLVSALPNCPLSNVALFTNVPCCILKQKFTGSWEAVSALTLWQITHRQQLYQQWLCATMKTYRQLSFKQVVKQTHILCSYLNRSKYNFIKHSFFGSISIFYTGFLKKETYLIDNLVVLLVPVCRHWACSNMYILQLPCCQSMDCWGLIMAIIVINVALHIVMY